MNGRTKILCMLPVLVMLLTTGAATGQDRHSMYPFEATEYEPSQHSYGVGPDTGSNLINRPVQLGETQWMEVERAPLRTTSASSNPRTKDLASANLPTVFFAFDSTVPLNPDVVGRFHFTPQTRVLLTGRTDPIGTDEYNDMLAYRRAEAVAVILEHRGMSRSQMELVSLGARSLIAPGNTDEGRQKNRQVSIQERRN
jgi:outer membrane protein OmpA-like peptidoglycan-associated protein